ncbi:MAG: hypothetical protein PHE30_00430 [Candidatus Omnitrophica bacterium]|nr:hypothetical protein [Candidatus Omnitrophota bacterium]MDD5027536.1 hypothetical protein [Candidatus Omnitrophota bacterium]MDD5661901.1 hypothetical protein [Candidatus Omnitrophota bacterium]
MNIFVGNLPFEASENDVKKFFEGFGNILSVVIVMEKQKTAPKSRGFGFVDMPDDRQALAAIAALNGKEFMGRPLNVNPARSKEEARAARRLKENSKPQAKPPIPQKTWFSPVFRQPGRYKGGRRTRSYMKRKGLTGMQEEAKPRKGSQDNPLRWRRRKDQVKPWPKSSSEQKPWKKSIRLTQKSKFKVSKNRLSPKK